MPKLGSPLPARAAGGTGQELKALNDGTRGVFKTFVTYLSILALFLLCSSPNRFIASVEIQQYLCSLLAFRLEPELRHFTSLHPLVSLT